VALDTPISASQKSISRRAWNELVYLAHHEKSRAFKLYADYYLSTNGQIYWSDTSQLGGYETDYHEALDRRVCAEHPATEMISELYVPRARFAQFMARAAHWIRATHASVIYGTVRLTRRDEDSLIPWAREDYACVIFNIHVEHTERKIAEAAEVFRGLIDLAVELDGSFYLTYHRWASRAQVDSCYPQFSEFLRRKRTYDPDGIFQSDWYRHMAGLYGEAV
jgi:FAD/FMN-containing dehydrogenase